MRRKRAPQRRAPSSRVRANGDAARRAPSPVGTGALVGGLRSGVHRGATGGPQGPGIISTRPSSALLGTPALSPAFPPRGQRSRRPVSRTCCCCDGGGGDASAARSLSVGSPRSSGEGRFRPRSSALVPSTPAHLTVPKPSAQRTRLFGSPSLSSRHTQSSPRRRVPRRSRATAATWWTSRWCVSTPRTTSVGALSASVIVTCAQLLSMSRSLPTRRAERADDTVRGHVIAASSYEVSRRSGPRAAVGRHQGVSGRGVTCKALWLT